MLPALQQIYSGLASLKSNHAAIQSVLNAEPAAPVPGDRGPNTFSKRECPPGGGAILYGQDQPWFLKELISRFGAVRGRFNRKYR